MDMSVLPVPHSPTSRTLSSVLRYFAMPVMVIACAGNGFLSSVLSAGAMGSLGP
jgi:hypothetical protein